MKLAPIFLSLILANLAGAQNPTERAIGATHGPRIRPPVVKEQPQQIPELYPGEIDDVGPQYLVARPDPGSSDGKTIQPKPHHFIESFADIQFFRTSNALLTEKGNQDTGVMVITAQAAFVARPIIIAGGELTARAGYRHQWWLYSLDTTQNQLNNFDFSVGTFFAGFRHSWDEKWVAAFALEYNRYLSLESDNTEFYTELAPNWAVERNIPLGDKTQLTAGYYGAYHWTQTDPAPVAHINDRLDNTLGVTLTQELNPSFYAQGYYRLQWSHYTENSDRNDTYNSLGFALIYTLNDSASIRTFVSYENRSSTDDTVADYGKWDSGLGVMFSARF